MPINSLPSLRQWARRVRFGLLLRELITDEDSETLIDYPPAVAAAGGLADALLGASREQMAMNDQFYLNCLEALKNPAVVRLIQQHGGLDNPS